MEILPHIMEDKLIPLLYRLRTRQANTDAENVLKQYGAAYETSVVVAKIIPQIAIMNRLSQFVKENALTKLITRMTYGYTPTLKLQVPNTITWSTNPDLIGVPMGHWSSPEGPLADRIRMLNEQLKWRITLLNRDIIRADRIPENFTQPLGHRFSVAPDGNLVFLSTVSILLGGFRCCVFFIRIDIDELIMDDVFAFIMAHPVVQHHFCLEEDYVQTNYGYML